MKNIIQVKLADFASHEKGIKRLEWRCVSSFLQDKQRGYEAITQRKPGEGLIWFSLKGFDYLNPDGLLWVLLIGEELTGKGYYLSLELPIEKNNVEYLEECGFLEIAREYFSFLNIFEFGKIKLQRSRGKNVLLAKIEKNTLEGFLARFEQIELRGEILEWLGHPKHDQQRFEYMFPFYNLIKEIAYNIVQHSSYKKDEGKGYFIISPFSPDWVRLCMGDAGQGFLNSLKAKGLEGKLKKLRWELKNDFDAIKTALAYKYIVGDISGGGLFAVVKLASQLRGVIKVRSVRGEATLKLTNGILVDDEETFRYIDTKTIGGVVKSDFPGVQFIIDLKRRTKDGARNIHY